MRRIVLPALAGALLALPAAARSGGEGVLALVSSGKTVELVRLDPVALTPTPGVPRVPLGLRGGIIAA